MTAHKRSVKLFLTRTVLPGVVLSILGMAALTAAVLALLQSWDGLWLLIGRAEGLFGQADEAEALLNYRAVMHYLSPFSRAAFSLPTLPFSPQGAAHFADCKAIFNLVYAAGALSVPLGVCCLRVLSRRRRLRAALRGAGWALLVLPLVIGLTMAVNFDGVFTLFHHVLFSNDWWMFSPETDPIILWLPASFFAACAGLIAAAWLTAGAACLLVSRRMCP